MGEEGGERKRAEGGEGGGRAERGRKDTRRTKHRCTAPAAPPCGAPPCGVCLFYRTRINRINPIDIAIAIAIAIDKKMPPCKAQEGIFSQASISSLNHTRLKRLWA